MRLVCRGLCLRPGCCYRAGRRAARCGAAGSGWAMPRPLVRRGRSCFDLLNGGDKTWVHNALPRAWGVRPMTAAKPRTLTLRTIWVPDRCAECDGQGRLGSVFARVARMARSWARWFASTFRGPRSTHAGRQCISMPPPFEVMANLAVGGTDPATGLGMTMVAARCPPCPA